MAELCSRRYLPLLATDGDVAIGGREDALPSFENGCLKKLFDTRFSDRAHSPLPPPHTLFLIDPL